MGHVIPEPSREDFDRRSAPIDTRVWDVDLPCPECGNRSLIGFIYLDQHGLHQHTHYVCTFWRSPDDKSLFLQPGYDASKDRCGWHGWSVPGWDGRGDESLDDRLSRLLRDIADLGERAAALRDRRLA